MYAVLQAPLSIVLKMTGITKPKFLVLQTQAGGMSANDVVVYAELFYTPEAGAERCQRSQLASVRQGRQRLFRYQALGAAVRAATRHPLITRRVGGGKVARLPAAYEAGRQCPWISADSDLEAPWDLGEPVPVLRVKPLTCEN